MGQRVPFCDSRSGQVKDFISAASRHAECIRWNNRMLKDLRFAFRTLARSPWFTFVAVLSLALGIGANTAIFSLVDHVFLRKLPVPEPERLVLVKDPGPHGNGSSWSDGDDHAPFSHPVYLELRAANRVFAHLAARFNVSVNVASGNRPAELFDAEIVSGNYFETLGVRAAAGRLFTLEDDRLPGAHPVVVLTHSCWQQRFGGRPGIIGSTLRINAFPMTVIGVTAPGFTGTQTGRQPLLFVPMMMKAKVTPGDDNLADRTTRWLQLIARLKPGLSLEEAHAGLRAALQPSIETTLAAQPDLPAEERARARTRQAYLVSGAQGRQILRNDSGDALLILLGMTGLVLLVACANVANLLIARGAARSREIAIRLSIGASRAALIRQLLIESALLAVVGGLLGLLVATWSLAGLQALVPGDTRDFIGASLDVRTLVITLALSLVTGLVFGLLPALQSTGGDLARTMKDQGLSTTSTQRGVRFRRLLVAAQFALSLILLVAGGLLARSLANLGRQSPGFEVERLVTFSMDASLSGYSPDATLPIYRRIRERLSALPGVRQASVARLPILADRTWSGTVRVEGCAKADRYQQLQVVFNGIDPAFLPTLGVSVAGRQLTESDDQAQAAPVALVNEAFARACYGGNSALGRTLGVGRRKPKASTIVGVVPDARVTSIRQDAVPLVYLPLGQAPALTRAHFYLRTAMPEAAVIGAAQRVVREIDGNLAVLEPQTLREQINETIVNERLSAFLSLVFALLAVTLAAVGLYGVLAFLVARRTREIGVRLALGAGARNVEWLVLREVLLLAGAGLAVGLPVAWALAKVMKSLLYGLEPGDPLVFGGAMALLAASAFVAGYWPARRASRIDPMVALRYD